MNEIIMRKLIKNHTDVTNPTVRSAYGKLSGTIGIIANVILFVIKLIVGTVSGSVSITADAVNNLSDASSSIISLLGFKLAEKPADAEHPYGHGRYEYLSGLSVAVLIIVIGVELLRTSIGKIVTPTAVRFSAALVVVLLFSVAVKFWMMLFNKKAGKKINSKTLIATAYDSRNDVLSTTAVLIAAIISHFTSLELDGWIGLIAAGIIFVSGFGLIKDTIDPMLGTAPDPDFVKTIRNKIMTYPGVLGMHDLIVHDYGPSRLFASVHVEMAAEGDVIQSHDIIDNIETDFLQNNGLHMIIHYDPVLTQNPLTTQLKNEISLLVKQIDDILTIHDLRVVPGTTHTNVVFDCLAPFELKMTDKEIREKITELVRQNHPDYNCVITVDRSYVPMDK